MISSEIFIIKRDGKKELFSLDKIKNAISKAFLSVGSFATQDVITNVLSRVSISDGTNVEEIQNQVEVALMAEHYYSVAKAYMLYRQKHLEDREVRDKLKFLLDYCDASNPATGSKYDSNANVENKNIATLIGELPKSNFIRLNRRLLIDRLKDMYGKEISDRYLDLLNHHFIYKNDETNLANYCASITMYPWLIAGIVKFCHCHRFKFLFVKKEGSVILYTLIFLSGCPDSAPTVFFGAVIILFSDISLHSFSVPAAPPLHFASMDRDARMYSM